ncbi:co-chaperone YbbN [Reinekea sp.]|jgi:putative thioredoxin|uniref:co-chaperone YbbN n=1 Tax=Reinekea sp. TaxID=1970455 RepID=UPI002A83BA91|nr:co-chaperone YbbN [Reinekea sp.]
MNSINSIVDVTDENFQQLMVEQSQQRLLVLDFWADWCAPCKALTPILEKLAIEFSGQFLLGKINADEQQALVAQFGVRSLPSVVFVKDGQPVDGFMGAEPESAIRERLLTHLPSPWQADVEQAQALLQEGQFDEALTLAYGAYGLSGQDFEIGLLVADCYLQLKRINEAQALLTQATLEQRLNPYWGTLESRLDLMLQAADSPEILELQQALTADPDNLELKYSLALQFSQHERVEDALQAVLEVLQKDKQYSDGAARKTMLDLLQSLGKGDPLAAKYQRKLFTLLY